MDGSGEDIGVRNRDAEAIGLSCSNVFNNVGEQRMSEIGLVGILHLSYRSRALLASLPVSARRQREARVWRADGQAGRISRERTTSSHRRRPVIPRPGRPSRRTADAVSSIRFAHASAAATRAHHTVEQGPSPGSPSGARPAVWAQRRPPAAAGEILASGNQGRVLATTTCGRSGDILNR
jgi:hypothetical protein